VSHNSSSSQARFAGKLDIHFPLLSDTSATVARLYGAKSWLPFFSRKTFVIDGRGLLRLAMDGMPDIAKLEAFLEALRGDLPESK
jgi:peroxiredoxin